MKRRIFIRLSVVGGTAIGLTGVSCNHPGKAFYNSLNKPSQLSLICDAKTIREIGMAYRLQTPSEKDADKLALLLSVDSGGNSVSSSSDSSSIQTLVNQKTSHDFEAGNMVTIKGWILSVTEARQCALFFITNQ